MRPAAAAGSSFVAFVAGALVPLVPYLLLGGATAFATSLGVSLGALTLRYGVKITCQVLPPSFVA